MADPSEGGEAPPEPPEPPVEQVESAPPETTEASAGEAWTADIPPPAETAAAGDAWGADAPPAVPEEPPTAEPPVEYGTVREALLDNIENEKLRNHADALYKQGASEGDGGTAAALFHEKETGELVGGKSHDLKAEERSRGLDKQIEGDDLSTTDREIAKDLKEDLDNAIDYKPPDEKGAAGG